VVVLRGEVHGDSRSRRWAPEEKVYRLLMKGTGRNRVNPE
jgi:hypothetical protein